LIKFSPAPVFRCNLFLYITEYILNEKILIAIDEIRGSSSNISPRNCCQIIKSEWTTKNQTLKAPKIHNYHPYDPYGNGEFRRFSPVENIKIFMI
jgi:hypothetical protein